MKGPVDLRLAVPACAAWGCAALACGTTVAAARWLVVAAALLLCAGLVTRQGVIAAVGVGALLGCASAMVHVALARDGPVAAGAGRHERGIATLTLVRDPQRGASAHGPPYVLADATVTRWGSRSADAAVLIIAHGAGWTDLLPGQRLQVPARLEPPRSGDGLSAVLLASAAPTLIGRPPWWQRVAGYVRGRLRRACSGLPADERGLVPGLVVGDVSAMPASLTADFRASGLTHLNAVSGENCAIVLATVAAVLRRTRLRRGWRYAVSAVSLVAFVVLARPSPSVLRAAVMGGAALAAGAAGRSAQPVPLLAGAVLLLVLVDPFLARAPGFALSVLATAAIVVGARPFADLLARRMPRSLATAIAVPAVAQVACTPVLVIVFGQVSPWAVVANLLAAPAVAPATVVGVTAAIVSTICLPAAWALAWAAAVPATWLAVVARACAGLPGAHARPASALLAVLIALVVVAALWRRRSSRLHAMLGAWPP
jgi:competence protein ComEC